MDLSSLILGRFENIISSWNDTLSEVYSLLTTSPQEFRGGQIWSIIQALNDGLVGIGLALLVIFFLMGAVSAMGSYVELKRPEQVVKLIVRFILAHAAVVYSLDLVLYLFGAAQEILDAIYSSYFGSNTLGETLALSDELTALIDALSGTSGILILLVTFIFNLVIWVLSIVILITVYGRFFKLYMYTAVAPIPLATFAGGGSVSHVGTSFIRSFCGVLLQGALIILACIIWSAWARTAALNFDIESLELGSVVLYDELGAAYVSSTADMSAVTNALWNYLAQLAQTMFVLVATIMGVDALSREMLGL